MIITKQALQRRTVLRGLGAALALPLLDAMVPALTATARTAARGRQLLGFYYAPSGMPHSLFFPAEPGPLPETLSPILSSFEPVRRSVTTVSGLSNAPAEDPKLSTGPHTRCGASWLSGVRPKRTEGADIETGKTIDQYAADVLGRETQLRSLELALDNMSAVGNCELGYSCAYVNTFSWRTATTPNPCEMNPRRVFERLFGDGGSAAQQQRQFVRERSILDRVNSELRRLQRVLGPQDRRTLDEYLQGVRDVERRIEKAGERAAQSPLVTTTPPFGIPEQYDVHARLMLDLQFLAFQADITRVSIMQLNREQSGQSYPWIGVPEANHDASHHGGDAERVAKWGKINAYHASLVAYLAGKMAQTQDGDGTLLDHAMLLFGSGMGDGNLHSPRDLPAVMVGHLGGQLAGGRHLQFPLDTPWMNLGLTVLEKVGVDLQQIGDSTAPLAGV